MGKFKKIGDVSFAALLRTLHGVKNLQTFITILWKARMFRSSQHFGRTFDNNTCVTSNCYYQSLHSDTDGTVYCKSDCKPIENGQHWANYMNSNNCISSNIYSTFSWYLLLLQTIETSVVGFFSRTMNQINPRITFHRNPLSSFKRERHLSSPAQNRVRLQELESRTMVQHKTCVHWWPSRHQRLRKYLPRWQQRSSSMSQISNDSSHIRWIQYQKTYSIGCNRIFGREHEDDGHKSCPNTSPCIDEISELSHVPWTRFETATEELAQDRNAVTPIESDGAEEDVSWELE